MLYSRISAHLQWRADLLLSDQLDLLTETYAYPLPVFLEERRTIFRSRPQAHLILSHLRQNLLDRGVVALKPRVKAIDLPRAGRFRVWVDWMEIAIPAEKTTLSSAVYYCRELAEGFQTEMVNYTRATSAGLNREIAALALTA